MILWILLIVGFLLSSISAFILYRDKVKEFKVGNSSSKSFKYTFGIAILGSLMALFSSVYSNQEKEKATRRAGILNDSLFKSQHLLVDAQKLNTELLVGQKDSTTKVISLQEHLISTQAALNSANQRIESLQQTVAKNFLGDGNLPKLIFGPASPTEHYNNLTFFISNHGKTPLRGLRIIVADIYSDVIYNKALKKYEYREGSGDMSVLKSITDLNKEIIVGDLPPGFGKSYYFPQLPLGVKDFGFHLQISWDNGYIWVGVSGTYELNKRSPIFRIDQYLDYRNNKHDSTIIELVRPTI